MEYGKVKGHHWSFILLSVFERLSHSFLTIIKMTFLCSAGFLLLWSLCFQLGTGESFHCVKMGFRGSVYKKFTAIFTVVLAHAEELRNYCFSSHASGWQGWTGCISILATNAPCGAGARLSPLSIYFLIFSPFHFFLSFLGFTYFFSFVHPFPFYQYSPTPFPGRRS